VIERCDKARLLAKGKAEQQVIAAIGRELLGFI
jgi:hypothetical protein